MVKSQSTEFTPEQAEERLRQHISQIPPLADAIIARVPDLDAAGLYAFSVMPRLTGRAGEVLYLIGSSDMLTSGQPTDFDKLMQRLGVGKKAGILDVHAFAHLFLRLRALRRGVVLDSPNGHVLLRPEQLPSARFSAPKADFDSLGSHYHFWMFDTDRMEPIFWDVRVAPNGITSFTSS